MMNNNKIWLILSLIMSFGILFSNGCESGKEIPEKNTPKKKLQEANEVPFPVVTDTATNLLFSYVGKTGQMVSVATVAAVPSHIK